MKNSGFGTNMKNIFKRATEQSFIKETAKATLKNLKY